MDLPEYQRYIQLSPDRIQRCFPDHAGRSLVVMVRTAAPSPTPRKFMYVAVRC